MAYVGPSPSGHDAASTLGPFVIGISFSCILTGMISTQAYAYFSRREDGWWMRAAVALVFISILMRLGVDMDMLWSIAVRNFGNYEGVREQPAGLGIGILTTSVGQVVAQIFFGVRCWRAWNRPLALAILFGLLITAGFIGNIGGPIAHMLKNLPVVPPLAALWLWDSAVTDIIISALLIYKLWHSRQDGDIRGSTRHVIDKVLWSVLSTASVTSACALIDAVLVQVYEADNNIHTAFTLCVPRLYAICLFFTLNSRHELRDGLHSHTAVTIEGSEGWTPRGSARKPRLPDALTGIDLESVAHREPTASGQDSQSVGRKTLRQDFHDGTFSDGDPAQ